MKQIYAPNGPPPQFFTPPAVPESPMPAQILYQHPSIKFDSKAFNTPVLKAHKNQKEQLMLRFESELRKRRPQEPVKAVQQMTHVQGH